MCSFLWLINLGMYRVELLVRCASEKIMDRKHLQFCSVEDIDFAPLVFDTFGGWTPDVRHVIGAKCAAARSGGGRQYWKESWRWNV